jgi:2'-5' RNA ligase
MRLFVAIDLDDAARSAIGREQKRIAAAIYTGGKALTWAAVDRMHLTLVFLGEVPDPLAARFVEAMRTPVMQPPFEAVFGGLGVFPPDRGERGRKPPRVLWLGVAGGAEATIRLQKEVRARLARLGAAIEERDFHPHLTLARWKRSVWSDRRRAADAAPAGDVARIHVDHVTLVQSRLSSTGPSYTRLARANLLRAES